ncbi:MAG: STAS domain-containing protein [Planctomycetota bacterium]|jgi:anti-anti-sigma regulatory factor
MADELKDFEVENGTLFVNRDMLHDRDLLFDDACRNLLESKEDDLLIDLSKSTYINSTYIGIIAATFFQANSIKKKLSLKVTPSIGQVLRAGGFEEFIPIQEI